MCSYSISAKARSITHALDDARNKRSAVQLAHFLRYAYEGVDQWLVVNDHVLILLGVALLQCARASVE